MQILQANPLMETERKLFVYFFTNPVKLGQVVGELARRIDALSTAQKIDWIIVDTCHYVNGAFGSNFGTLFTAWCSKIETADSDVQDLIHCVYYFWRGKPARISKTAEYVHFTGSFQQSQLQQQLVHSDYTIRHGQKKSGMSGRFRDSWQLCN